MNRRLRREVRPFDIGQYKQWKRMGVPDSAIEEELGISATKLRRLKEENGLVIKRGVYLCR